MKCAWPFPCAEMPRVRIGYLTYCPHHAAEVMENRSALVCRHLGHETRSEIARRADITAEYRGYV